MPWNIFLDSQAIGLRKCFKAILFHYVYFRQLFLFVPWSPVTNDSLFRLHYQSLQILPPLSFNSNTIADLDDTHHVLDGQLTDQIQDICKQIKHLQAVSISTTTDVLAFTAFAFRLFYCLFFFFFIFTYRLIWYISTVPTPPTGSCFCFLRLTNFVHNDVQEK